MRPEQRWCDHCKVIYDLAIYNEQNLYNLAHCDGFSGTTPPSRKRQGGVNQKPQALQTCILTTPGGDDAFGVARATGHHHRVEDTMMIGASETRRSW